MHDLLIEIFGTFLGALAGIPAGLAINYFWTHHADSLRREKLMAALRDTVQTNLDTVQRVISAIQNPNGIVLFNADSSLLEATASLKYELIDDIALCQQIDRVRYQLGSFSKMVTTLLDLEFNATARALSFTGGQSMYAAMRSPLVDGLRGDASTLIDALEKLKSKLAA